MATRYDELLTAAGYTRHTSEATTAKFGFCCYIKEGASDINFCTRTALWADEGDESGTDAVSLVQYLLRASDKAALYDFNYVGSRHHY